MEIFNHPVYHFWNGKNLADDEKSFTTLTTMIEENDKEEFPCILSSETMNADET